MRSLKVTMFYQLNVFSPSLRVFLHLPQDTSLRVYSYSSDNVRGFMIWYERHINSNSYIIRSMCTVRRNIPTMSLSHIAVQCSKKIPKWVFFYISLSTDRYPYILNVISIIQTYLSVLRLYPTIYS